MIIKECAQLDYSVSIFTPLLLEAAVRLRIMISKILIISIGLNARLENVS